MVEVVADACKVVGEDIVKGCRKETLSYKLQQKKLLREQEDKHTALRADQRDVGQCSHTRASVMDLVAT